VEELTIRVFVALVALVLATHVPDCCCQIAVMIDPPLQTAELSARKRSARTRPNTNRTGSIFFFFVDRCV
jgi:hypothetical protein